MKNIKKRLSLLEQAAKAAGGMALDYRRAEELSDEELAYVITGDPEVRPEDISDEDLERMADGETWPLDR